MFEIIKCDCPRYPRYANTYNDVFDIISQFSSEEQAIEASSWAELAILDEALTLYDDNGNKEFTICCFEED